MQSQPTPKLRDKQSNLEPGWRKKKMAHSMND
jgi:hypothetical protein